jgi:hypothetical protein
MNRIKYVDYVVLVTERRAVRKQFYEILFESMVTVNRQILIPNLDKIRYGALEIKTRWWTAFGSYFGQRKQNYMMETENWGVGFESPLNFSLQGSSKVKRSKNEFDGHALSCRFRGWDTATENISWFRRREVVSDVSEEPTASIFTSTLKVKTVGSTEVVPVLQLSTTSWRRIGGVEI